MSRITGAPNCAAHILRAGFSCKGILAFVFFIWCPLSTVQGADAKRVEEDWELVLSAPASASNAPQLDTVMSPLGHIDSFYARITWNYGELPDYSPGGLQLQAWNGDRFLFEKRLGSSKLSVVGETVTWTQRMTTDGSRLTLQILNGHSTTWGPFGGSNMQISGNAYVPNLNDYSTDVSAGNSAITFGSQRVPRLRIKEVRRYAGDGALLSTDATPRILYEK